MFSRATPSFEPLMIRSVKDTLVIETFLKNGFNKGLDEIIMSGSEVIISYNVRLLEKDEQGDIAILIRKTFYQSINFYPADNRFAVITSIDSLIFTDMAKAKDAVSRVRANLVPTDWISNDKLYSIRIEAALNTIEIEALNVNEFDLNAFWNFKYPKALIDWTRSERLVGK